MNILTAALGLVATGVYVKGITYFNTISDEPNIDLVDDMLKIFQIAFVE